MATRLGPIPLFGIGNVGRSVNVNAQQRTNLYVEVQQESEKSRLALFPTPGLVSFVNFGAAPCRGIYRVRDYLYLVNRNTLWRVANDGTTLSLGTLVTSTGRVDFSDNGTQIIVVDGPNGYIYNIDTAVFTQISSPGFPGATSVTFLNGYFVVTRPDSGEFYASAIYDGLTWSALEFATAESNPDNLVRVIADNGQLCLFGPETTEFWGDSGALDFPFARVGASAIEWGLAARWSLCKFMDSLIFLRKNRLGAVQVCTLSGYVATPVSTPEMDYVFSQYSAVENATGFSYMVSGHPFYQINFPSANESWLYDGLTKAWSKVESSGGRHRAEMQINFLDQSLVTDYETGKVYRFDENALTDDGAQIARELITRHQSMGSFTSFDEVWLEMEPGVGVTPAFGPPLDDSPLFIDFDLQNFIDFDGELLADFVGINRPAEMPVPEVNPRMMMSVSKDGGKTYGKELWVPIGQQGEYRRRAVWRRLGRSRDFVFRFRMTDPVKPIIVAAWGRQGP